MLSSSWILEVISRKNVCTIQHVEHRFWWGAATYRREGSISADHVLSPVYPCNHPCSFPGLQSSVCVSVTGTLVSSAFPGQPPTSCRPAEGSGNSVYLAPRWQAQVQSLLYVWCELHGPAACTVAANRTRRPAAAAASRDRMEHNQVPPRMELWPQGLRQHSGDRGTHLYFSPIPISIILTEVRGFLSLFRRILRHCPEVVQDIFTPIIFRTPCNFIRWYDDK